MGKRLVTTIGWALVGLSAACWIALLFIPMLPVDVATKGAIGAGVFVAAEVLFWIGAILAGPEAIGRLKKWFQHKLARNKT